MIRTITALFDARADAEAAQNRIQAADMGASAVVIHDKTSPGFPAGKSTRQDPGMWATIKHAFLPDEDRHTYEEGMRRGGFLLTADVAEEHVADVVRVLEEADTVDIDSRADTWRASGWDASPASSASGAVDAEDPFFFGTREADRGGAGVRSYVSEVPFEEQMRKRDQQIG